MLKNRKSKIIISSILLSALLFTTVAFSASEIFNKNLNATFGRIKLNYKNKDVTQEVEDKYNTPVFTVDNRAYVPVRAIADIMGVDVKYDDKTHTAVFTAKSTNSTNRFDKVPLGIQIANLGTSHAQHALIYDDLDLVSFSFAMPAQRLYYDYKLLEKYIAHFEDDASLIVPISYISFYLGYDNENFKKFNTNYYDILDFKDLKNVSKEEYVDYKKMLMNTAEDRHDNTKIDRMNYTISKEEMIEDGRETSSRHLDFIEEGRKNKEEFVKILDDIISLALENNINPVITTTPFTKYYNDHFSDEFYDDFTNTVNSLVEKYPGVNYLDYSHDKRFTTSPKYFFDSGHLNVTGGREFTKIILDDIEKLKQ